MDLLQAIEARHSVRAYKDQPIEEEKLRALREEIDRCNSESGLHVQLVVNEPVAFSGAMAHYGRFSGVTNYIALAGKKGKGFKEACGYYGERLVLTAQTLGLNTCWVALTYKKVPGAIELEKGEKLLMVIALGYGKNGGVPHKGKDTDALCVYMPDPGAPDGEGTFPEWFEKGVRAAALAPTALNQQKFQFVYFSDTGTVQASAGVGIHTETDLGIVKYHFEIGSGKSGAIWEPERKRKK